MSDEDGGLMSDGALHSILDDVSATSWQRSVARELLERRKLDVLHEAAVALADIAAGQWEADSGAAGYYVYADDITARRLRDYRQAKAAPKSVRP
jgi:hypothetical protein